MIELGLFWASCMAAIAGAVGAATVRNLLHAALLLGLSLSGIAGLYLFLEAPYLACIQVVVYIGGILVLILFATLFSADITGRTQRVPWWARAAGAASALLSATVAWRLSGVVLAVSPELASSATPAAAAVDAIAAPEQALGDMLVGPWVIPFLAGGVLLTVALVGAVATVRRFRRPARAEGHHG